ncbi:MAG: helicase HerA-like domain-containing protein [Pseudomonadota bacterium]
MADTLFIGGGGDSYATPQKLTLKYANRHGLIAGATGTGKTITLQILAEEFSAAGVPVFLADVKGDVSGLARPGVDSHKLHEKLQERAGVIGLDPYVYQAFPVVFWDMFGAAGHPVRTTVAEMGPLLLSRLLDLTDVQEGVLNIAFRLADEEGLALLDLKDLRALLVWLGENAADLTLQYGNISTASIGAIQRSLVVLENQGGEAFFGEPALELTDLLGQAPDGRGQINVLAADKLMAAPQLYSTFLLWLLSELFEQMPEVGDPDKPKLVFFFDEAHLLFDGAPKALVDKVEQVARLIRSKGVGVYFVTQNPDDVPEDILGQLGNRVQHALRAFTPRDQKALRAAAETFRPNPAFDTEEAIRDVGVGEAVVSTLEAKGVPSMVERTLIRPPSSQIGPISAEERAATVASSPLAGKYETAIDRRSAYEILKEQAEAAAAAAAEVDVPEEETPWQRQSSGRSYQGADDAPSWKSREYRSARRYTPTTSAQPKPRRRTDSVGGAFAKSLARTAGTQIARQITRGILGGLFRGR